MSYPRVDLFGPSTGIGTVQVRAKLNLPTQFETLCGSAHAATIVARSHCAHLAGVSLSFSLSLPVHFTLCSNHRSVFHPITAIIHRLFLLSILLPNYRFLWAPILLAPLAGLSPQLSLSLSLSHLSAHLSVFSLDAMTDLSLIGSVSGRSSRSIPEGPFLSASSVHSSD